jgi:hypothetical protein
MQKGRALPFHLQITKPIALLMQTDFHFIARIMSAT